VGAVDPGAAGPGAEPRPAYLPPDPASRTAYAAGEIAQCDLWFPPVTVPVGCGQVRRPAQLPVLTMVCAYSRWLLGVLIPTRTAADLFAGWWQLIGVLGAVPRVLVWDGEGAIGRWRAGRPELTADCQAFRGTLGAKVVVCKPADPEAKGLVERAHDYLERSFLPGRTFAGPADFNAQLAAWLALVNTRSRRALGCSPDQVDGFRVVLGQEQACVGEQVDLLLRAQQQLKPEPLGGVGPVRVKRHDLLAGLAS
jgi:transposase